MKPIINILLEVRRMDNGSPVLASNIKTNSTTKAVDIAMAVTELEKLKLDLLKLFKSDMEMRE